MNFQGRTARAAGLPRGVSVSFCSLRSRTAAPRSRPRSADRTARLSPQAPLCTSVTAGVNLCMINRLFKEELRRCVPSGTIHAAPEYEQLHGAASSERGPGSGARVGRSRPPHPRALPATPLPPPTTGTGGGRLLRRKVCGFSAGGREGNRPLSSPFILLRIVYYKSLKNIHKFLTSDNI